MASVRPAGKYAPLQYYLQGHPGDQVTLTFAEIERVLGGALPERAGTRTWWWHTEARQWPHVRAWRAVGWRVGTVDVHQRVVTFARVVDD